MKNQYFGDNRDLLKYDLVCQTAQLGLVDRFTYVPMLTENETQNEEPDFADQAGDPGLVCRHLATAGVDNKELVEFLDKCIANEKRNIGQLEEFLQHRGIKATVYRKDKLFTHKGRMAYFDGIGKELLTKSLILVDPDMGLEEDTNDSGNLLYSELQDLYERMDADSYLMFTQRFPYDLYEEYLGKRITEIKDRIPGSQPISIDDLDSIIFFITKNKSLQNRLLQFLGEYTKKYAKKG